MNKTAIYILAGGLGTRLSHILKDIPKPMAPLGGKKFLEYQIEWLRKQGFKDLVLLVGHKKESIMDYFGDGLNYGVKITYSIEDKLLGTGGAVIKALKEFPSDNFIILNGDTFFNIDLKWFLGFAQKRSNQISIALKYKEDVRRYGYIEIDDEYNVKSIIEKSNELADGYINGGIYCGQSSMFKNYQTSKMSLEKDIFPLMIQNKAVCAVPFGDKFIDIGIPEDYYYADKNLSVWTKQNKVHALFLDRDGVIIEDKGYVHKTKDVRFIEKTIELVKKANKENKKVIVVTNQAGVAKGKFSINDVYTVNNFIDEHYRKNNAYIDDYFFCPYHKEGIIPEYTQESLLRKPEPGMLLLACEKHNLDLQNSTMIGDQLSDIIKLPYLKTIFPTKE